MYTKNPVLKLASSSRTRKTHNENFARKKLLNKQWDQSLTSQDLQLHSDET